jgi:hypothetical protein
MKAMRKDREERYERPLDLARDVENYLAGRPLAAAPEYPAYRARKWLRRNRRAAQLAAAVLLGLAAKPVFDVYHEWSETRRMHAFEVLAMDPDPAVVTDFNARARIVGTGRPWKIRHVASGIVLLLVTPGDPYLAPARQFLALSQMQPYYLGESEVTKAQWRAIVGKDTGAFVGDDLPVQGVSWNSLQNQFISRSRGALRLPMELEWEHACRAGTETPYSFGETIDEKQVCLRPEGPVACGSLPSNPWGFHEMHGNVAEWVEDEHEGERVVKGGCFGEDASYAVSSGGFTLPPDFAISKLGFRVATFPPLGLFRFAPPAP